MTFRELQEDVYEDTGANNPAPQPDTQARIRKNLNKAHRKILTDSALVRLRHTANPLTFASAANRAFYGLPASLEAVRAITERATMRRLLPMTLDEVRDRDPGLTTADTPTWFVPIGYKCVANVPSSTGLWAVSSSASDTTQTVQVAGVRSAIAADDVAVLTGTSRVAIGTVTDYVDVLAFTLSSLAVGTVSLYDAASSGNLLAEIPIGQLSAQYFMVQIYPTPAAAVTYYVDGTYRVLTLSEAQDVPQLPDAYHDLLSHYAKEQECIKQKDGQAAMYWRNEFNELMSKLRHRVGTQDGDAPVVSRRTSPRASRYGANYPIGPF
jgi:hypothetical protein